MVLGVISITGLLVNIYLFNSNPEIVIKKSNLQLVPFFGYFVAFVFHISALFFLMSSYRSSQKQRGLKFAALILLIFSLVSFMVDKVMIDELADELRNGFDLSLFMLTIPLVFKVLYSLLVLLIVYFFLLEKQNQSIQDEQDETIFTLAQIVGIVTGILGVIFVFSQMRTQLETLFFTIPIYLIFLVPYALIGFYWLMLKFNHKEKKWYDEKQWADVTKSGLVTLLLSIPGLAILFLINKPLEYLWFPYYLFLILFLFSGCTMFFFKRS